MFRSCAFAIRLCYSITSAFACQVFFFEIFSSFDLKLLALAPLCQTALIDYHVFPRLSSPFFEFFFSFRSLSLDTRLSCETASLDYHASPLLVNSFFPFFRHFCVITSNCPYFGMTSMQFLQRLIPVTMQQASSPKGNQPVKTYRYYNCIPFFYSSGPDTTTQNGPSAPSASSSARPRASRSA